jgi:hypothetical protein
LTLDKRTSIKELLIDEYWRPQADAIIDRALAVGFNLDTIAAMIVHNNTDMMILMTYWKPILEQEHA